ncbi:L-threonylcarbamoyladenylate synthase [Ascidiaceihabitans sp.]|uniref:L-threonylcarbamoyladenylate synthase n=1 Tax=Ascidiaceihabitans sp. TaxID=1872644 RepID=UPI003298880E
MTDRLTSDTFGIDRAATLLREGALVALPTETVYGLGADARNSDAVANIYAAKGRPSFNPLIVHVSDIEMARRFVVWSDTAQTLADAFWPGALTLVLPLKPDHGISSLVTAGLTTLAVRMPDHPVALAVLSRAGIPIAAPSANLSGRISPTTANHVLNDLDGKIAAVLDNGPCPVGVESTIVGLIETPTLLRPGGVTQEDLETVLKHSVEAPEPDTITAPGQLASHYAPTAQVRLNAAQAEEHEVMLGFGEIGGDLNLSETSDLIEAASNLFDHLHKLDETQQPIAVAPIPNTGLGQAINDRLKRAAAPKNG